VRIERLPDLSSRELLAVCTIAEYGSFMAASLTLNVSQPALTRTVQRVEKAIGLELFQRSTRRVEITPAGLEFIALANRVLADLRISFDNMREISDELRGRVVVSSVMSVAYTQLPGIIARYRQTRSKIELQVQGGVHGAVIDDVRSGVADLGLTYIDDVPAQFSCIALSREAFHIVMPKAHPLAAKASVTIEQLHNHPLVSLPREAQTRAQRIQSAQTGQTIGTAAPADQGKLALETGEIERAILAKVMEKVGSRDYWDQWAQDIARIAQMQIARIMGIVNDPAKHVARAAFEAFTAQLHAHINTSLTREGVIEMLAQHLITRPVFDALFGFIATHLCIV